MTKFDAYEFGKFINDVKENIRQIENGSQVFNGTMYKDRVVSKLKQIARTMEKHSELMTKYIVESEHHAEIGRATEKAFEKTDRALFVKYYPIEEDINEDRYVDIANSPTFDSVEDLLEWAKEEK